MPPRKDLMRIIRPDASFAATLGFGRTETIPSGEEASNPTGAHDGDHAFANAHTDKATSRSEPAVGPRAAGTGPAPSRRGTVIYVAVSLTEAQAVRAEHWAAAASCAIPLLMRRTAQTMRKDLFALWAASGVDRVEERRGARGHHATSVTLTLTPDLAAAFSAQLDPMGIIGLGRAIGPAFRKHFETAFDAAAEKAGF